MDPSLVWTRGVPRTVPNSPKRRPRLTSNGVRPFRCVAAQADEVLAAAAEGRVRGTRLLPVVVLSLQGMPAEVNRPDPS